MSNTADDTATPTAGGRGDAPQRDPAAQGVRPVDPGSVHLLFRRDAARLVLTGEIDAELGPELLEAADEAQRAGLPVEVDAHHVTFMDSTGVAFLARLASRLGEDEPLTLIRPPSVVRFLVDVTAIGSLIRIVDQDPHPYDDSDSGDLPA